MNVNVSLSIGYINNFLASYFYDLIKQLFGGGEGVGLCKVPAATACIVCCQVLANGAVLKDVLW